MAKRPFVRLFSSTLAAATLSAFTLASAPAWAAPLVVTPIPWVATNPDIPHVTLNGKTTTLKAIAEEGECGGSYSYRWDWNGDGDFDDAGEDARNSDASGHGGLFATLDPAAAKDPFILIKNTSLPRRYSGLGFVHFNERALLIKIQDFRRGGTQRPFFPSARFARRRPFVFYRKYNIFLR